ncbi:hypothetical protein SNE26_20785 [Mucilaginibacter sp. cycad4]|uniref:hypothetical protein n=1 Tax=Mucilaginibacter sp. cycad4 TaxID=3342096 RepID=UPI002AAAB4C1|nr:hypothetical protein [Mucilaginibacter gossypii]WPU98465.1 hypothetical protein SNE26_20785 [Mucilaginibacter gossypii]
MKKLISPLYVILIVITTFCTTNCGKSSDGGGGGGVIVLLGDLIGFWQSGNDSFTFDGQGGQLGGTGTVGGRSGAVTNSKIDKYLVTFDLVFEDDHSVKNYSGTIDQSKKILKLTSSGATATFNKQ